jgi:sensor c-di-GMP phosphodiesterase-like protein
MPVPSCGRTGSVVFRIDGRISGCWSIASREERAWSKGGKRYPYNANHLKIRLKIAQKHNNNNDNNQHNDIKHNNKHNVTSIIISIIVSILVSITMSIIIIIIIRIMISIISILRVIIILRSINTSKSVRYKISKSVWSFSRSSCHKQCMCTPRVHFFNSPK